MPPDGGLWTEGPRAVIGVQFMGKVRRKFDVGFKFRICEAIRSEQVSTAEVCREYQLARSMVNRWLEAYDEGRLAGNDSSRVRALERENEQLKAKVGELTMQIDVLKKIEAWKRRQRSVASSIITAENLEQFQKPAEPQESQSRRTTTKRKKTR
jgi:transposase-like protein